MDPLTFLARLAAQIPPPRCHVLSYYGVLGAAAARRDEIVPQLETASGQAVGHRCKTSAGAGRDPQEPAAATTKAKRPRPERLLWAELVQRVYLQDILCCPCGGRRRVLSMVFKPSSIERVLRHLGLPYNPPQRAPPRPLPAELPFRHQEQCGTVPPSETTCGSGGCTQN